MNKGKEQENIFDLSEKEKVFVVAKAKGKTNVQAALESYEISNRNGAKVIGSDLMDKPLIKMALNELMETYLPQHYRIRKLRSHAENLDPVVSLKALDLSWKLNGSYAPTKYAEIFDINCSKDAMQRVDTHLEEIRAKLRALGITDLPEIPAEFVE